MSLETAIIREALITLRDHAHNHQRGGLDRAYHLAQDALDKLYSLEQEHAALLEAVGKVREQERA